VKLPLKYPCNCGGIYSFSTYGDADYPPATCSNCGKLLYALDPLSVSVTAERLLYRSKAELEDGDYSLSILIAVMAVESYLTRQFLKLKGMQNYAARFRLPTAAEEAQWEKEYPRSGGFLSPAGFVSQRLMDTTFDDFVSNNKAAGTIFAVLSISPHIGPAQYIQDELFQRRNRIAHWGYVDSTKAEAELCHKIAVATISILREMDRLKYGNL
jgi:hypothetical protein